MLLNFATATSILSSMTLLNIFKVVFDLVIQIYTFLIFNIVHSCTEWVVLCNNLWSCWNTDFLKKIRMHSEVKLQEPDPFCFKKTLFPYKTLSSYKAKFCSLMPKSHKYFTGIKLIFASHFPAALEPNKAQFYTSLPSQSGIWNVSTIMISCEEED